MSCLHTITMGIHAILVINNHGQPRLLKFYNQYITPNHDSDSKTAGTNAAPTILSDARKQGMIYECFQLVSKRSDSICNFLENTVHFGSSYKLIYRHYATLYFIFVVDGAESELGILDLIQVFVESLDKCFENVCELDLIFHVDKCYYILDEIIQDGCVVETSLKEILKAVNGAARYSRETEAAAQQVKQIAGGRGR